MAMVKLTIGCKACQLSQAGSAVLLMRFPRTASISNPSSAVSCFPGENEGALWASAYQHIFIQVRQEVACRRA